MQKQPFLLLLLLFPVFLYGQTPTLQSLGDISRPVPSGVEVFRSGIFTTRQKDATYFKAIDSLNNYGLWHFDGEKCQMIESGPSSYVLAVKEKDHVFMFENVGSQSEWELIHSNGQPFGTETLDQFTYVIGQPGEYNHWAFAGSKLVYRKPITDADHELWVSDGTQTGTHLLKDLWPGANSGNPVWFASGDSLAYFKASSNGQSNFWRTNGTPEGTWEVSSGFSPWILNVWPSSVLAVRDRLFFITSKTNGTILWTSDGTPGSVDTVKVLANNNQGLNFKPVAVGGKYMFQFNDNMGNLRWWISDGTAGGTYMLNTASASSSQWHENGPNTTNNGNTFFFTSGNQLWRTDGDSASTTIVASMGTNLIPLTTTRRYFYFLTLETNNELRLWRTEGVINNVTLIKNLGNQNWDSPYYYAGSGAAGDSIVLRLLYNTIGEPYKWAMFRSDGTEFGTQALFMTLHEALESSNPEGFVSTDDNKVFFRTGYNVGHNALQIFGKSINTTAAHFLADTILSASLPVAMANKVFWVSEGDSALSVLHPDTLVKINIGRYIDGFLSLFKNKCYFLNKGLWSSDGTADGTVKIIDAPDNTVFWSPATTGDSLYWLSRTSVSPVQYKIWRSDGTAAGTTVFKVLPTQSTPRLYAVNGHWLATSLTLDQSILQYKKYYYTSFMDTVYRLTNNSSDDVGYEIIGNQCFIVTDNRFGTIENQLLLIENGQISELAKFEAISEYSAYTSFLRQDCLHSTTNGSLLWGGGPKNDQELWLRDENGIISELIDLNPAGSSFPDNFVRYNDQFWLFTAFDGEETAWWATDGTVDGTFKIIDIPALRHKTSGQPLVSNAVLTNARLLCFGMNDGYIGNEPWMVLFGDSLQSPTLILPETSPELSVWPNPFIQQVQVKAAWPHKMPAHVQIMDASGRVIRQIQVNAEDGLVTCSISFDASLAKGVYYVGIGNGRNYRAKTIVKSE